MRGSARNRRPKKNRRKRRLTGFEDNSLSEPKRRLWTRLGAQDPRIHIATSTTSTTTWNPSGYCVHRIQRPFEYCITTLFCTTNVWPLSLVQSFDRGKHHKCFAATAVLNLLSELVQVAKHYQAHLIKRRRRDVSHKMRAYVIAE